ncbi:class I SAM-dependent methyltransferase [Sphingobium limneticum]|uniref:Class I SAM-dependent methyltransferase n=1 Tax=Sphingobium limneticum TaxID=1007511 RepID=A0A5J5IBQ3_9SPHN|nr:class I SAM-dependent methyltransferase [Sphingobium limneticum]KAA9020754.1 class I SAM-dependent methyltransferase [Sphingobium limneticum]KAA9033080.1 class I SAM-dependent methyltransferase [Sphingobium limneticum]
MTDTKNENPLKSLAIRHGTDKFGIHDYTGIYWDHLKDLRSHPISLLEIGVGGYDDPHEGGASLAMWRDFFPQGKIVGIDVFKKELNLGPRVSIETGSQSDGDFLREIAERYGPFDVVIDDGSHVMSDVIYSFQKLFSSLKPGGLYIVEDSQTSFFEEFGGGSRQDETTVIGYFSQLFADIDHREKAVRFPAEKASTFAAKVKAIFRYHNLIILSAGQNTYPSNFDLQSADDEFIDGIVAELTSESGKPNHNRLSVLFDFLLAAGRHDSAATVLKSLQRLRPRSSGHNRRKQLLEESAARKTRSNTAMPKKLCFMHIPKTAGSSVNEYFTALVGENKSKSFAEHDVYGGDTVKNLLENFSFLSGHLFYGAFSDIDKDDILFTILRDPYEHITSQLKWLKGYSLDHRALEKSELASEVREVVDLVSQTSLESVHELDELLIRLPPFGFHLLNNMQSRFIIGDSGNFNPLSLRDIGFVAQNLKRFHFVTTVDDLPRVMPKIAAAAGYAPRAFDQHVNKGIIRSEIDLTNNLVRRVLEKHITVDLLLYDMVKSGQFGPN